MGRHRSTTTSATDAGRRPRPITRLLGSPSLNSAQLQDRAPHRP
ncbi:hypothetical protein OP10G_1266 [Fimbriimonas ginsengisoli Gsoil 348]|uniref:Uncharacterized protein n=1 Tax=Fimbriimonas ginsengisoli Gsoil 348 TaxID=661478 RepID=A0A068NSQ1_FIMGI|nr:hypothetical protein OP10G_1266 [Fimbriimonas ginsengisoli Gsoil 348]